MSNIDKYLTSVIIQQIGLLMLEQGRDRVDLEKVTEAAVGLTQVCAAIEGFTTTGLSNVDKTQIDEFIARTHLETMLPKDNG